MWGAKFGATPLPAFDELVEHRELSALEKVEFRYEQGSAHTVVVESCGFQLCTCLQVLRSGLPCRHIQAHISHIAEGCYAYDRGTVSCTFSWPKCL